MGQLLDIANIPFKIIARKGENFQIRYFILIHTKIETILEAHPFLKNISRQMVVSKLSP